VSSFARIIPPDHRGRSYLMNDPGQQILSWRSDTVQPVQVDLAPGHIPAAKLCHRLPGSDAST